jgi:hypothetical protein
LNSLRHWKATILYHKTRDIFYVKDFLRHRDIRNTLVYTQLVTFEDDEYLCKAASNVKEARELVEAGYEYVATWTMSNCLESENSRDLGFAQKPGVQP